MADIKFLEGARICSKTRVAYSDIKSAKSRNLHFFALDKAIRNNLQEIVHDSFIYGQGISVALFEYLNYLILVHIILRLTTL